MTLDQAVLSRVEVVNVGLAAFGDAIRDQDTAVVDVDWRPPAEGDPQAVAALERLWGAHGATVAAANERVLERMEACTPRAVGVATARDVLPVLAEGRTLIHSGPPIEPHRLADPQRRALVAACLFEGWADDRDRARAMIEEGVIGLASGNESNHVGAMTGVCSPSMPVWVVEDEDSGARAFSTFNEGAGKTLWFGTDADEAIERLRFFRDDLGPLMGRLIDRLGPDRDLQARGAGPASGRRAAHAQPGDRQPADPRPAARLRGARRRAGGALPVDELALLPEPHDGRVEVHAAGRIRRARRERRVADLAQRHRRGRAALVDAGALVSSPTRRRSPTRCCARATRRPTRRRTSATRR